MGVYGSTFDLIIRNAVGSGNADRGNMRHHNAKRDVSALIVENAVAHGADAAVRIETKSRLVNLLASVVGGKKTFAAGFDPFDSPSQPHRQKRNQGMLRVVSIFNPEAPTDIGRNHSYIVPGKPHLLRQQTAREMRRLRVRPDRQSRRG